MNSIDWDIWNAQNEKYFDKETWTKIAGNIRFQRIETGIGTGREYYVYILGLYVGMMHWYYWGTGPDGQCLGKPQNEYTCHERHFARENGGFVYDAEGNIDLSIRQYSDKSYLERESPIVPQSESSLYCEKFSCIKSALCFMWKTHEILSKRITNSKPGL